MKILNTVVIFYTHTHTYTTKTKEFGLMNVIDIKRNWEYKSCNVYPFNEEVLGNFMFFPYVKSWFWQSFQTNVVLPLSKNQEMFWKSLE